MNEGDTQYAQKVGEDRALCTSEFSDISPLSGGNVAFATLDGRPGAYNFDHNRELQYWVSATDIRYDFLKPSMLCFNLSFYLKSVFDAFEHLWR